MGDRQYWAIEDLVEERDRLLLENGILKRAIIMIRMATKEPVVDQLAYQAEKNILPSKLEN
jgi:hypothetical protein